MNSAVAAIVLAAGEGSRFGQPKALAIDQGRTYLQIALERLLEAGFHRIAVVLGAEEQRIRADRSLAAAIRDCSEAGVDLTFSHNLDWSAGRTGSIALGLVRLASETRAALIHQVDFPRVNVETFRRLAGAFEIASGSPGAASGTPDPAPAAIAAPSYPEARIFLPVHEGRRGHPIVIGRALWAQVMAMGKDEPLRNLIRGEAARVTEVPVDDPGILLNVNTPAEAPPDGRQ